MSILSIPKVVGVAVASLMIAFCAGQVGTPAAAPESTTTTVVTTTVAPTTTQPPVTTTTLPDLSGIDFIALQWLIEEEKRIVRQMEIDEARMQYGKCGEWRELALSIGWPAEEWYTMSHVLYRESRCSTISHYKADPMSGSRGLMQINGYWCRPSKWSKAGWLQDRGILTTCDDLFDPTINLKAGLAIWLYGEEKHGCGWRGPWATSCDKYTKIQPHP